MMPKIYVNWDEVYVSNDKGSRVVHYYLKDAKGNADLAVVGREKSIRHMVYTVSNHFLHLADSLGFLPSSSLKWRSKREVVDWLSSLISDSAALKYSPTTHASQDDDDLFTKDTSLWEDFSSIKSKSNSEEFRWLGSSWKCRKRRKHFRSFACNGITVSVHDFVHVMLKEDQRCVAYLEDMYEDSKGNRMVLVRLFNNGEDIGASPSPYSSDREIFFSVCLQDLSVECIDGLATILSPQHFERYFDEAAQLECNPFFCHRKFDGADIVPFDLTQLPGYWSQKLVTRMCYSSSCPNDFTNAYETPKSRRHNGKLKNDIIARWETGNSRLHRLGTGVSMQDTENIPPGINGACGVLPTKNPATKPRPQQQLSTGCPVEVLSQDSGSRGCWFRALILKKNGDKAKVRYEDLLDADETGHVKEWVLLSRVASVDDLGVRTSGRTTIRPCPPTKCRLTKGFNVGTVVDARWHDGWWEGIVVRQESESEVCVFFPGEQKSFVFDTSSLRHSQEWVSNKWSFVKERPDVLGSLMSLTSDKVQPVTPERLESGNAQPVERRQDGSPASPELEAATLRSPNQNSGGALSISDHEDARCTSPKSELVHSDPKRDNTTTCLTTSKLVGMVRLGDLKWNPSKKRRRGLRKSEGSSSSSKEDEDDGHGCSYPSESKSSFSIPNSMKKIIDGDQNCKYEGSSSSSSPLRRMALLRPPLSSLVMSR